MRESEQKQWAKEHYKGIDNLLLPSYKPNMRELDEDGIRHDVRQSIRHGFFSTSAVAPLCEPEEYQRVLELACDEGKGKILVGAYVGEATQEANRELLAQAEKAGCSHAVLVPRYLTPESEEQVFAWYKELIDSTRLPIVLYAQNNPRLRHLHPSGIALEAFEQLARLPSVVAVKLTQAINLVRAMECAERLGDKILVGPVHLDMMPLLSKACTVQWSGQWNAECAQSPEKPYVADYLRAIARNDLQEAYSLYWQLEPAYSAFFKLQAPLLLKGGHPWAHLKYNQWCVGGNGGLVRDIGKPRDQVPVLTAEARERIRQNYRSIGIEPNRNDEEEFVVGAANFAKGFGKVNMANLPLFE
ncbi:dihydrodipicolinate synthase family protein [Parapusillimonas sp. JC17]|uniref:dihydrodipicolinate synthase family protein n=1 Tax=Parapusillimonas sp. JC17 TaxID=3445768 RepID=UPI003F9F90BB